MPKLRQLEYLIAIADYHHFGRAAQASGVSQPTLSQQLRALEERLGVALVERGPGGAELTPVGRDLTARARRIVGAAEEFERFAKLSAGRLAGTVRLGITPTLGPYLLPRVISRLHEKEPSLRFHVREGIPNEQQLDLARGRLDVVITPLPADGHALMIEPIFREPLILVAATDHPLAALNKALGPDELDGHQLLNIDNRHHHARQTAEFAKRTGLEILPDYEGTSLDSLQQMAASGLGLAMLPEIYLRSDAGGMAGLVRLKLADAPPYRSIAAAWREGSAFEDGYHRLAKTIGEVARETLA
ncbi:MAG: hydrogen peroxide-inducible genes activator [Pacificimonas sp.]|jgi:LysR family hydrogen peroxide-inducible transcriptional activator|nr:hydrogen peroxide-inducible genes activator [Pacificimonas sp.]